MPKCKKVFKESKEVPSPPKNHIQTSVLHATENHLQQSVPGYIIRRQFSFGDIILSFGDIFLFIGDIILSFGDNFLFFGNISSNFKIRHKNIIFANFISRIHTIVTNRIAMKQKRMYLCCINHKGWCSYGLVMTAKSGWRKYITTSDIHQNLQPSTIFFSFSR